MSEQLDDDKEYMLTTVDNPYDPFTQWDQWFSYDAQKGYNTPGYLARLARTSLELGQLDEDQSINDAMQRIVKDNFYGVHRLVSRKR